MGRIVILARHGSHDEVGKVLSGRSDIGLNAEGRTEAEALARVLEGAAIASLHSSPRRRARETVAPLAERCGLTVRLAPALDEIDFGAFTGLAFERLDDDPDWRRWNAQRDTARCPSGETMDEASGRAEKYIAALPPCDFPAVCVTHCDIIRGLVARHLGLSLDRLFALGFDPGSRTTLQLCTGGVRLVALNERLY
jgi:probable phosphoglycerate mutase